MTMPKIKLFNPEDVKENDVYRLNVHSDIVAVLVEIASESRKYWTDQAQEFILEGIKARGHYPILTVKERKERKAAEERDQEERSEWIQILNTENNPYPNQPETLKSPPRNPLPDKDS